MRTAILASLIVAVSAASAAPALAKTDSAPGTDVCVTGGTGNPCNGDNGNAKSVGNAGHKTGGTGNDFTVDVDQISGRVAVVDQLGSRNMASIAQSGAAARAVVTQNGDDNRAALAQSARSANADVIQTGDGNRLSSSQTGNGAVQYRAEQTGSLNQVVVTQNATSRAMYAALKQTGSGNMLSLTQNGDDNVASLTQDGSANALGVSQTGASNALTYTQIGNGLAAQISQSGGSSITLTQNK